MLYVSSSCVREDNIAKIIHLLAQKNIKNIELSGGTDYYTEIENDLKNLKQIYDLRYVCHAYFPPPKEPFVVNLASCNDAIYKNSIEHYENCINLLKNIECDTLSVHAGFLIEIDKDEIGKKINSTIIYDEKEAYSRFCYAYEWILKQCKKYNIKLYLENNVISRENYIEFENHNYFMMTDYNSIMYMKKQLEFDLLLDLGHLNVSANTLGFDYTQECSHLKEYVKWIHISDNNGIYDQHRPIIENSIVLEAFYRIYKPDINVTLETIDEIKGILKSMELLNVSIAGEKMDELRATDM